MGVFTNIVNINKFLLCFIFFLCDTGNLVRGIIISLASINNVL